MQIKADNAFQKGLEVQKSGRELQASGVDMSNQLSLTQQNVQQFNEQKDSGHLQSQMSVISDKLSHAQQQLLDMQKSNERLQATNVYLQDQLSLTKNELSLAHQQVFSMQSLMTSSRLWVVSHDQFTIGREIGRGAWATVHEATFQGATVAAKCLDDEITSPATREQFHQEMQIALYCQHHNIVTFLGVMLEDHPIILMELMDVSLRSAYKRGNVKYSQVLGIFCDVASALHF